MFKVRNPRDFGSGVVLMVFGLAGLYFGLDLTYGTAARMGPGYFPRLLSWLIIAIGLFIALKSLVTDGPPIERPVFRPIAFVLFSILIFGYLMDYVGLAITGVVLVLVAAYARKDVNLPETLIYAVGLSIGTVLIFAYGLGQPLPAWWGY